MLRSSRSTLRTLFAAPWVNECSVLLQSNAQLVATMCPECARAVDQAQVGEQETKRRPLWPMALQQRQFVTQVTTPSGDIAPEQLSHLLWRVAVSQTSLLQSACGQHHPAWTWHINS